ncbi:hypothetical protein [Maricaulis sp.]
MQRLYAVTDGQICSSRRHSDIIAARQSTIQAVAAPALQGRAGLP